LLDSRLAPAALAGLLEGGH